MPQAAATVFGAREQVAAQYAALLADTGVSHGLIGPREVPRLWGRHILNCAAIEEVFPAGATIIDVGSGAGLPGLALAIARPDLHLHLVEPMQRRTLWLSTTVRTLGLDNVVVHRARAEDLHGTLSAPFVTARAVARIDKLARWCFPLLSNGGTLVALKGRSAPEELDAERPALGRLGMTEGRVTTHGAGVVDPPTYAMQLLVGHVSATEPSASSARKSAGRGSTDRAGRRRRLV